MPSVQWSTEGLTMSTLTGLVTVTLEKNPIESTEGCSPHTEACSVPGTMWATALPDDRSASSHLLTHLDCSFLVTFWLPSSNPSHCAPFLAAYKTCPASRVLGPPARGSHTLQSCLLSSSGDPHPYPSLSHAYPWSCDTAMPPLPPPSSCSLASALASPF